ncbi:hypothetical protein KJ590_02575 [Patescibacteria group bacterium]|nr:hypothetical protein [Patescibacteria group bacterium]
MAKVINLKSQEDITSVIERLWETGESEVFLVASKDSALLKNIIALKLLKREADRLGKEVVLITKDEVGREMAKRVGLTSRVALPKKALEEEEEVFRQVSPEKFESMLEGEVRARREAPSSARRFSDIRPKEALIERQSTAVEQVEEKITLPTEELFWGEAPSEKSGKSIGQEKKEESFLDRLQRKYQSGPEPEEDEATDETATEGEEEPEDFFEKQKEGEEDQSETVDAEESGEEKREKEEEDEDFPIYGLAEGSRRIRGKAKKPFFGRWPWSFKKINAALKIEKVEPATTRKQPMVPFFSGRFLGLFIGAALVVAMAVLYFILPKAEISVKAKKEPVNQELSLVADKGASKIDAAQNKVPAQLIKLDKRQSQEFSTTGQRQVNDKAVGRIVVYNEYSSSPQALVEKTRFLSAAGQVFRLTKSITVPGAKIQEGKIVASSIEAEVVADQAGADYNVAPARFTIPGFQGTPKYAAFYGQSNATMSGGASGVMKVVTQGDYDKAKSEIWKSLQPALDSEFKSQLPGELKIIDGAMKEEVSAPETSVAVGAPAEKFTMTLKGTATAVLFDEKNILEVIQKKLTEKVNSGKDLSLAAEQVSYQLSSIDYARGQILMKVKVLGGLIWKIDTEALRREIVGQDEKAIREIFAKHPEVSEAKVVFWPFWVSRAPADLDKVIIKVSE